MPWPGFGAEESPEVDAHPPASHPSASDSTRIKKTIKCRVIVILMNSVPCAFIRGSSSRRPGRLRQAPPP
jgi:hypothetical protein